MNFYLSVIIMQDDAGQPYSQSLSGASLSDAHHVPATEGHREALSLDRCGLFEVLLHQHIHHILCQEKEEDNVQESYTDGLNLVSSFQSFHPKDNPFLNIPLVLYYHCSLTYYLNS